MKARNRHVVRRLIAALAVGAVTLMPSIAFAGLPITAFELAPVEPLPGSAHDETLDHLGLHPNDIIVVRDHTFSTDSRSNYRFADSLDGPATVSIEEFPFLDIQTMSFGSVNWQPGDVPDVAVNPGDGTWMPLGDGILPDTDYILGTITLGGPLPDGPAGPISAKNIGMVLSPTDAFPFVWEPAAAFPFDTWRDGCCAIWTGYSPNPWTSHVNTINSSGSIDDTPIDGFIFLHQDTVVFGANQQQLLGGTDPTGVSVRFYFHGHDGQQGSCPDCPSSIVVVPDMAQPAFIQPDYFSLTTNSVPDPVDTSQPAEDSNTAQGSEARNDGDPLTGSEDDDTLSGSGAPEGLGDTDDDFGASILDEVSSDDPVDVPGDGGPRWPWLATGGGVLLLGGGEVVRRRHRKDAVDPNDDNFLYEALAGLGGTGSGDKATTLDSTHMWNLALAPELDAQDRIKKEQSDAVGSFVGWHGRFKAALVRFAQAYLGAWQGSDALRENQTDWRVHRIGAQAVDLAVALIQLVRGAFMLGRGLAGWYRGRQAAALAAKSADEIAALRAAADEALEASPAIKAFADDFMGAGRSGLKSYRDELVDVIMWGQDAGIDIISIMTRRLDEMADIPVSRLRKIDILIEDMIPHIMRGAGLVEAAPTIANAVENTAPLIRVLATEGAPLTDEGAAAVRAFVQMVDDTPGFWDDAGNMFVKLARGTDDALTGELAPLVSGDRLSNLRSMYDAFKAADGDISKLPGLFRDALGPAKATAISAGGGATSAIPSALMQDGALAGAHGGTMAGTSGADAGPAQVGLGTVDAQMHQYGITGDSFAGNMWDLFTSPVETTTGIYYSWGALDEINDIFANNATDLSEMSSAWTQLINSLGGLETMSSGGVSGHDSIGTLETALRDLERAQQGLRDVYDDASREWQQANQQMYDEKMAHIDKKRAAIQRLVDALRRLKLVIGRMKELLENMEQTPDGDRRTSMEWIDPALSSALSQVAFQLEGIGHEILATD